MEATSYPKEKIKVLLLENVSDTAVRNFSRAGYTQVEKLTKALPEADLVEAVKNVHLLGIRSKTQITERVYTGGKTDEGFAWGRINWGSEKCSFARDPF